MTREEAVARIKEHIEIHRYHERNAVKIFEALDMAIKALEQPEIVRCEDCKHHWTHSCMDAFPREICDLDQTFYDSNFDYCSLAERRENG